MTEKRFTITKGFDEHERQIRDNGKIIMGCFIQPQAEPIVKLLNELHEENQKQKTSIKMLENQSQRQINRNKRLQKDLDKLYQHIQDMNYMTKDEIIEVLTR